MIVTSARLIVLLWVLSASSCLHAACHVVSSEVGGTAQNGNDWTSPYRDLPVKLFRGDVYYIGQGVYAPHTFDDPDSGSRKIEVKAATLRDHCTERGWRNSFAVDYTNPALPVVFRGKAGGGSILRFLTDEYVIDGQVRYTSTKDPALDWPHTGYGIEVDNANGAACDFSVGGNGSSGARKFVHDVELKYMEIRGSHPQSDACLDVGVAFEGGSYNLVIDHTWIHDDYRQLQFEGNHGHPGGGDGYGSGSNITVQYSWLQHDYSSNRQHGEGCQCSEGLVNFTFRFNYMIDEVGTAYIATASGAGFRTGNDDNGPWLIYGNVFGGSENSQYCATGDGVIYLFDVSFADDLYFVNNTIVNLNASNCAGGGNAGFFFDPPSHSQAFKRIIVQNNLFWNSDHSRISSCVASTTCVALTVSHNAYFRQKDGSNAGDTKNAQKSTLDPFKGSEDFDFHLARHTNAGFETIQYPLLHENGFDMAGTRRGDDSIWDRGAFQMSEHKGSGF